MRIVARTTPKSENVTPSPRMYFVHIPKTAGITLKAFLENNYAGGESLVIDEWKARELPPEELRRYRLLSGHYSSEVLAALGERPDATLMLVREPVSRFRSWMAHCRRLSGTKYRDMCEGRSDLEVLTGPNAYTCHQAHWLARALEGGAAYATVPAAEELASLIDRVDVAGLTEEIERFMQLVAFRMGWPPPQLGWHINRRPDTTAPALQLVHGQLSDDELRKHLAVDEALYAQTRSRFWQAYANMLTAISPGADAFTADAAQHVAVETVQGWLRDAYVARTAERLCTATESMDIDGVRAVSGEGWWWRESPKGVAYRWTGPSTRATILAAPLVEAHDYALTIEAMGAADWQTWEAVGLEVNGKPVRAVHERFTTPEPGMVSIRLQARLTPDIVSAQDGLTSIAISVPETKRALSHVRVLESVDTYNQDMRQVGLAVHRVQIAQVEARVLPALTLRRVGPASLKGGDFTSPSSQTA